jgi:hypothetical protein
MPAEMVIVWTIQPIPVSILVAIMVLTSTQSLISVSIVSMDALSVLIALYAPNALIISNSIQMALTLVSIIRTRLVTAVMEQTVLMALALKHNILITLQHLVNNALKAVFIAMV